MVVEFMPFEMKMVIQLDLSGFGYPTKVNTFSLRFARISNESIIW